MKRLTGRLFLLWVVMLIAVNPLYAECPICMCQESESSNSGSDYERDVQDEQDDLKEDMDDAIDAAKEYADELGRSVDASREALLLAVEEVYLIERRTNLLREAVKTSGRMWDMGTIIAMGRLSVMEQKLADLMMDFKAENSMELETIEKKYGHTKK